MTFHISPSAIILIMIGYHLHAYLKGSQRQFLSEHFTWLRNLMGRFTFHALETLFYASVIVLIAPDLDFPEARDYAHLAGTCVFVMSMAFEGTVIYFRSKIYSPGDKQHKSSE